MKTTKLKAKEIMFAEFKKGKVYVLPVEEVQPEIARRIGEIAKCVVVLLPRNCFNLSLLEAKPMEKCKHKETRTVRGVGRESNPSDVCNNCDEVIFDDSTPPGDCVAGCEGKKHYCGRYPTTPQDWLKEFDKEFPIYEYPEFYEGIHKVGDNMVPYVSEECIADKLKSFISQVSSESYERGKEEERERLAVEIEREKLISNIALMKVLIENGTKGDMERLIEEFTEKLTTKKATRKVLKN